MKKPGFPPSTLALVALMLGALFMVSKMVTPPPASPPPVMPASATTETSAPQGDPGHGEPGHVHGQDEGKKPDTAAAKPDSKKQQEQMRRFYEDKMKNENKQKMVEAKVQADVLAKMKLTPEGRKKPPKYDPSNNNIDSRFFTEMPMGDQGIEATDKAVAQAEVIKVKMRQVEAAMKAKQPPSEKPKQTAP